MIELEIVKLVIHAASTYLFELLLIPVAVFSMFFYFLGVSGLVMGRKGNVQYKSKITPKVTVQIPTRNELVAIRCAEKCLKMDYPKGKYEILIGDDSSDPSVSRALDDFAARSKGGVRVVRRSTNKGFKAGNLNNMTRHSRGDIIIIFDSDFMPPKNFLREIVQPFEDEKMAYVQAKWSYVNMGQSATSKFASTVLMVYHNLLARLNQKAGVALLFGSGEAVRKSVLVKLGGWQPWNVTEDVEFSVRALKNGYKSHYMQDLEVAGEIPYNVRSLRTQQRRWAYGNMKAFIEHRRSILLGKFSLIQKFFLSATMLGYVASFFLVAFMFFGGVSFMTGEPSDINVLRLVTDVIKNFVLASGFTFAGIVALGRERKLRHVVTVFFAALTIGILVSLSVLHGIAKAIGRQPMYWTLIKKAGNEKMLLPQMPAYGMKKVI